jgi:PilZ domain
MLVNGHFKKWLERILDRRECPRMLIPVIAYYWNGAAPEGHQVKSISPAGAYIVTGERWYPGTIVSMMFQYDPYYLKVAAIDGDPKASLTMRAKIMRVGGDGVGVRFVYLNAQERRRFEKFLHGAHVREEVSS